MFLGEKKFGCRLVRFYRLKNLKTCLSSLWTLVSPPFEFKLRRSEWVPGQRCLNRGGGRGAKQFFRREIYLNSKEGTKVDKNGNLFILVYLPTSASLPWKQRYSLWTKLNINCKAVSQCIYWPDIYYVSWKNWNSFARICQLRVPFEFFLKTFRTGPFYLIFRPYNYEVKNIRMANVRNSFRIISRIFVTFWGRKNKVALVVFTNVSTGCFWINTTVVRTTIGKTNAEFSVKLVNCFEFEGGGL